MPTSLDKRRNTKTFKILKQLNKERRQGEDNYFDCGELGVVHIWWNITWQFKWVVLSEEFKSDE